jgi:hypothetical protein
MINTENHEAYLTQGLARVVYKGQTLRPVEEGQIYVNWLKKFPALCSFWTKRDGKIILYNKLGEEVAVYHQSGADKMLARILKSKHQEEFNIDIETLTNAAHNVRGAK